MHEVSDHPNLTTAATIESALEQVRDASPADVIFITGSLFLVAEARAILTK
jgi:folylpolyglutamate synthase/dihydropteroate synthase